MRDPNHVNAADSLAGITTPRQRLRCLSEPHVSRWLNKANQIIAVVTIWRASSGLEAHAGEQPDKRQRRNETNAEFSTFVIKRLGEQEAALWAIDDVCLSSESRVIRNQLFESPIS